MNRNRCLEMCNRRIEFERNSRDIIQSIPEKTLLLLTFNRHTYNSKWKCTTCTGVGIIKTYNLESIRFNMLALDYTENERNIHDSIRFGDLLKWEPFPETDLPLLLGWKTVTPFISEYLKG